MQKITTIDEIKEIETRSIEWVRDIVFKKYSDNPDVGYAVLITKTDYSKIDESNLIAGKYFDIWVGIQKNQVILERQKEMGEWLGAVFSPISVSSKFLGFGKFLANFEEDVKAFFNAEMDKILEVYLQEIYSHYPNVADSCEMVNMSDEVIWVG